MLMADDKTTNMPEQPVTDTGPGKETPPEQEKTPTPPEAEKKTEQQAKSPQVSVYDFAEIMKGKKAEERAAASGGEKPAPAKTEKPEKQPEAPKKAEGKQEKPKEPEQPKRRGRPPKEDKDKAAAPKPKAPAQKKQEKAPKEKPEKKAAPMHLCFVPLTEDGRLSAKDIMGNKKKLTWWQDEFWKHMVKKFPDLERGESASLTGRDHIPPRVFKEMTRLTKQKEKLGQLLTGINPFNAKSRAEEICKILDTYIPSVEKMDTLLRKYGVAFTKTASENKKLKTKNAELEESLASAQKVSTLKQIEDLKLRRDYDSAVAILEQIPAEVLEFYKQPHRKERENAYDR